MEKLSVEELEELREKEFDERAERAERIQNTISLFRKIACVLAVMIAAAFIFFHVRKDYNNYAGSQLVMAEVINVEGADDENINVTYQYNIAGKKYESDKIQYTEKIKKGDKKEIRVKKNNPEVILKCNDINYVVLCDVLIGLCLELAVLCLYEMATCTLPSAAEEAKTESVEFTTKRGVTFSSIVEENKKKNKKINPEKKI
ncbi:hypothetical protein DW884_16945 [Ruminococcus sp. AM40-10AC]|nr:hypothetical protein DW884_16945 [Ruminococcus sp. AM40-10AC]